MGIFDKLKKLAGNLIGGLVKRTQKSADILAQFAHDATGGHRQWDWTSTQREAQKVLESFASLNRRQKRALRAMSRHSGKPPHTWFTKRRTPGSRETYRRWLRDLNKENPFLAQEARKVWGKP
jgi:hypothetical protein